MKGSRSVWRVSRYGITATASCNNVSKFVRVPPVGSFLIPVPADETPASEERIEKFNATGYN